MSSSRIWTNWLKRKRHSDPPPAQAAEPIDPLAPPRDMESEPVSVEEPSAQAEMVHTLGAKDPQTAEPIDPPAPPQNLELEPPNVEEPPAQAEMVDTLGAKNTHAEMTSWDWLARGEIAKAKDAAHEADDADALLAFLDAIEAGQLILGPATAGRADGVMLAPSAGHRMLIVFGEDRGGFSVTRAVISPDRPHVLFIEDNKGCLGFLGVNRLGPSYDACLSRILGIARHLGATELFCMGAGAGMFSAMRYGLDLGASGVLGLGTITRSADIPPVKPARLGRKLASRLAELGGDLGAAYAQAADRPALVLCEPILGMESPPPPALAGWVDEPHRSQAPQSEGHRLLRWADETGHLEHMLKQLLASSPVRKQHATNRRRNK